MLVGTQEVGVFRSEGSFPDLPYGLFVALRPGHCYLADVCGLVNSRIRTQIAEGSQGRPH